MLPLISCIKSLSEDKIVTGKLLASAFLASEAIKSSASNPSSSITAKLNALAASLIKGNCDFKSSGASGLFALYSL